MKLAPIAAEHYAIATYEDEQYIIPLSEFSETNREILRDPAAHTRSVKRSLWSLLRQPRAHSVPMLDEPEDYGIYMFPKNIWEQKAFREYTHLVRHAIMHRKAFPLYSKPIDRKGAILFDLFWVLSDIGVIDSHVAQRDTITKLANELIEGLPQNIASVPQLDVEAQRILEALAALDRRPEVEGNERLRKAGELHLEEIERKRARELEWPAGILAKLETLEKELRRAAEAKAERERDERLIGRLQRLADDS